MHRPVRVGAQATGGEVHVFLLGLMSEGHLVVHDDLGAIHLPQLHHPRVVGDNLQVYVIRVDHHSSQLSQILDPLLQLQYCSVWRGCSARVSLPSEPFSMLVMSACVDGL